MTDLCHKCRKKQGWAPRDKHAHTAIIMKCEGCGETTGIWSERHYVKTPETEATIFYYIIYDGRAIFDEDEATILEVYGEGTYKQACDYFYSEYKDMEAVLFEYDIVDGTAQNGRMVGTSL